jgi:predicted DNA-binding protein (UPF0251 family)
MSCQDRKTPEVSTCSANTSYFKPEGVPVFQLEETMLSLDEFGFKLIDLIGMVFFVLIMSGIVIHAFLRIVVKK